jgi:hypothetical protein
MGVVDHQDVAAAESVEQGSLDGFERPSNDLVAQRIDLGARVRIDRHDLRAQPVVPSPSC